MEKNKKRATGWDARVRLRAARDGFFFAPMAS